MISINDQSLPIIRFALNLAASNAQINIACSSISKFRGALTYIAHSLRLSATMQQEIWNITAYFISTKTPRRVDLLVWQLSHLCRNSNSTTVYFFLFVICYFLFVGAFCWGPNFQHLKWHPYLAQLSVSQPKEHHDMQKFSPRWETNMAQRMTRMKVKVTVIDKSNCNR